MFKSRFFAARYWSARFFHGQGGLTPQNRSVSGILNANATAAGALMGNRGIPGRLPNR